MGPENKAGFPFTTGVSLGHDRRRFYLRPLLPHPRAHAVGETWARNRAPALLPARSRSDRSDAGDHAVGPVAGGRTAAPRLDAMRAQCYPRKEICCRFGCDRTTAWRRWQTALLLVAGTLNGPSRGAKGLLRLRPRTRLRRAMYLP